MTFKVRTARTDDAEAFSPLLASLGYPSDPIRLRERIPVILNTPGTELLVATAEDVDKPLGLLSLHFLPQLGLDGDVAHICFLVVDGTSYRSGIGKLLESHAEKLARERGCDRMEVHCHQRRTVAHKFYAKQGYHESPKYLVKLFNEETAAEKEWKVTIALTQ